MKIKYDDGTEETVSAGDVFYMPAGHNALSNEEVAWIEFSPEKELKKVFDHLAKQ
jgi:quercetin dioxygenase-like cupin family protein